MIRLPGCTGGGEDTVLCHYRMLPYCGTGIKPPDEMGAFGCAVCHAICDGRMDLPDGYTYDQVRLAHAEAVPADAGHGEEVRMSIRLRIQDWLHEREIRKLGHHCVEAMASGRREEAIHFWQAQCKAINERSPAQVERMERRMGLHPRRTLKRSLMTAYFARFVPAFLVTIVFKLFKLRGL